MFPFQKNEENLSEERGRESRRGTHLRIGAFMTGLLLSDFFIFIYPKGLKGGERLLVNESGDVRLETVFLGRFDVMNARTVEERCLRTRSSLICNSTAAASS